MIRLCLLKGEMSLSALPLSPPRDGMSGKSGASWFPAALLVTFGTMWALGSINTHLERKEDNRYNRWETDNPHIAHYTASEKRAVYLGENPLNEGGKY